MSLIFRVCVHRSKGNYSNKPERGCINDVTDYFKKNKCTRELDQGWPLSVCKDCWSYECIAPRKVMAPSTAHAGLSPCHCCCIVRRQFIEGTEGTNDTLLFGIYPFSPCTHTNDASVLPKIGHQLEVCHLFNKCKKSQHWQLPLTLELYIYHRMRMSLPSKEVVSHAFIHSIPEAEASGSQWISANSRPTWRAE